MRGQDQNECTWTQRKTNKISSGCNMKYAGVLYEILFDLFEFDCIIW